MSSIPFIDIVILIMTLVNSVTILDYTGVSGFQNPHSSEAALVNYNGASFKTLLSSAWSNAEKAKNEAIKISFSLTLENFTMSFSLVDDYYKNALSSARDVFSQLKARAVSDYILLDKLGVDSVNNTGVSKQKLEKLMGFFASFETADSKDCANDLRDLSVRVSCLQSKTHIWSVYEGVFVFNSIVSLDDYSVLKQLESLHQDILKINESMHEMYYDDLHKVNFLAEKLSSTREKIEYEKIYLVTRELQNAIKTISSYSIVADSSGSLQERASKIDKTLSDYSFSKESAETKFKGKNDNYLIDSIVLLSKTADELNNSLEEAELILEDAASLRSKARKQLYETLKNNSNINDPMYVKATDLYEKAALERTGEAITSYSRGISLLESLKDYDFSAEIKMLKKALESLQKLGYDISLYENSLDSLDVNAENSESIRLRLDNIKGSIYEIIREISSGIQVKKIKAQSLLSSAEVLVGKYYDSVLLEKTQYYSQRFKAASSQDLFSNAYEISSLYDEIIVFYTSYFSEKSQEYVLFNSVPGVYFEEVPQCNEKQLVTYSLVVTNNLPIPLTDVHTIVDVFNMNVSVDINVLEPGKKTMFKKQYYLMPVNCSQQKNSSSSGYYYSEIDVETVFPVEQAIIEFNIPSGMQIISVVPAYSFYNNQCLAIGINGKQKVIIQYKTGNVTSVPFNITLPVYSDAEIKINLSNNIQDICFFMNCSDIKAMNESAAESAVNLKKQYIADSLSGSAASQKINSINNSISVLSKALDSNSDVVLLRNYSSYEGLVDDYYSKLSSFSVFFNKISGMEFEELTTAYSKTELKNYFDGMEKLDDEINFSTKSIESLSKVKLSDSVAYYKNNPDAVKDYLQKAKDSFDSGYFMRSMIYSDFIALTASEKQFPYQYIALALVVTSAGVYVFKKPNERNIQKREIMRKIRSV